MARLQFNGVAWSLTHAEWLADGGQLTPAGHPAVFRSFPHATMSIRLLYLEQAEGWREPELRLKAEHYRQSWTVYVSHCQQMCAIVGLVEAERVDDAATLWNEIRQADVDRACRTVMCERELLRGINVATRAWRYFDLENDPHDTAFTERPDRQSGAADNNAAWDRAGGLCSGCGTSTISDRQRALLHAAMESGQFGFQMADTYEQHNQVLAQLWPQLTIAAKGVADHVRPWSKGGRTDAGNLTNVCAACNYSRGDSPFDPAFVAGYRRPPSERESGDYPQE